MEDMGRKIGQKMSIYMGVTLSFILSLVGTLTSGHFTVMGFLISFIASTIVALIIGKVVPMGKISQDAVKKCNLIPSSVQARMLSALISDLIYTPIITALMVFIAYRQAVSRGASLNYWGMLLPSLLLSLVVAFFCIYFIEPVYMNKIMQDIKKGTSGSGRPQ